MVTVEVFAKALDRAVSEGLRVRPSEETPGRFDVSSGTRPGTWYLAVSPAYCGCMAAKGGSFCKHRALVAYVTLAVEDVCRVKINPDFAKETYEEVLAS